MSGLNRCLSLPHSWEFFRVGPKQAIRTVSRAPLWSPNARDFILTPPFLAVQPQTRYLTSLCLSPHLQREGHNILTSEGSRENGSAHRKFPVHILAIVPIITNPWLTFILLSTAYNRFSGTVSPWILETGGWGYSALSSCDTMPGLQWRWVSLDPNCVLFG